VEGGRRAGSQETSARNRPITDACPGFVSETGDLAPKWYSVASLEKFLEADVRKAIVLMIVPAIAAVAFLAGCQSPSTQNSGIPVQPKWTGAPYRLAFGAPPAKANRTGLTLPPIKFTANPQALERRADLVIKFDTSSVKTSGPVVDEVIMSPTDISGAEGTLPADYVDQARKSLETMLATYCINGKVKLSVALASSTLMLPATDDQVSNHLLSDWLPIEVVFKGPHRKC
jgi:hypothetical protein